MKRSGFVLVAALFLGCADLTQTAPEGQFRGSPALSISAAVNEAVLPSGYTGVMGEINNSFPHAQRNLRYQQVFNGSDVADPLIVGLCLRRDETTFSGTSATQTISIKLGPTSLDYTTLGTVFDDNYSAPPTEVFSGDVVLPVNTGLGTPTDFDFCIPFTQSYNHPAGSNVIVEVINSSATSVTHPRDGCDSAAACTTARAFAFSTTATNALLVMQGGLVMKFMSPEPPPPQEPVVTDDCKKGAWADFGFKNQGQCVRFVETGFDSRPI